MHAVATAAAAPIATKETAFEQEGIRQDLSSIGACRGLTSFRF